VQPVLRLGLFSRSVADGPWGPHAGFTYDGNSPTAYDCPYTVPGTIRRGTMGPAERTWVVTRDKTAKCDRD